MWRPDGSVAENKYGKVEDENFTKVGEGIAVRRYRGFEEEPQERTVQGGVVDTDQPRLIFPLDMDVREGDRIAFRQDLYIASNDSYTIYSGEAEEYTDVTVDGTFTVDGTLRIIDPTVYELTDDMTGRKAYREYRSTVVNDN